MIKHPLSYLGGLLTGMLVMYYLDERSGGRRRALVRDKLVAAGHDIADLGEAKGKRALDRARGVMATGSLRGETHREPESDAQLHDRIRARLGRIVGHPRSVEVHVDQGCVRFTGHILRKDVDALCSEVQSMPGVKEVRHELQVHDSAEGIPELQGSQAPPGREGQREGTAWH